MRVGLVVYGSLDTLSGGYLYDRKLAAYLREMGDTVEVISMPWQNYPLHLTHNFSRKWERKLASLEVDVLVQDELNHPSLFWSNRRLQKKIKFPLLSIVHHLRINEAHPPALLPLYKLIEHQYLLTLNGFIFNSQTTRKSVSALLGNLPRHIVAYPAGDRFGSPSKSGEIHKRSMTPGPLRLLFVGNLIPRKGLHSVFEALKILDKRKWILRVVGGEEADPTYAAEIHDTVSRLGFSEQVQFLGHLDTKRLAIEWQNCHLLVVPSQYEGFGIVYLEGMGFGVPSVASTQGAAGEIIENGKSGVLVSAEDPHTLAMVINRFCEDKQYLLSMSLAARTRFDHFPKWDETCQAIRGFLISWL